MLLCAVEIDLSKLSSDWIEDLTGKNQRIDQTTFLKERHINQKESWALCVFDQKLEDENLLQTLVKHYSIIQTVIESSEIPAQLKPRNLKCWKYGDQYLMVYFTPHESGQTVIDFAIYKESGIEKLTIAAINGRENDAYHFSRSCSIFRKKVNSLPWIQDRFHQHLSLKHWVINKE